jgi:hypothetical protein
MVAFMASHRPTQPPVAPQFVSRGLETAVSGRNNFAPYASSLKSQGKPARRKLRKETLWKNARQRGTDNHIPVSPSTKFLKDQVAFFETSETLNEVYQIGQIPFDLSGSFVLTLY